MLLRIALPHFITVQFCIQKLQCAFAKQERYFLHHKTCTIAHKLCGDFVKDVVKDCPCIDIFVSLSLFKMAFYTWFGSESLLLSSHLDVCSGRFPPHCCLWGPRFFPGWYLAGASFSLAPLFSLACPQVTNWIGSFSWGCRRVISYFGIAGNLALLAWVSFLIQQRAWGTPICWRHSMWAAGVGGHGWPGASSSGPRHADQTGFFSFFPSFTRILLRNANFWKCSICFKNFYILW